MSNLRRSHLCPSLLAACLAVATFVASCGSHHEKLTAADQRDIIGQASVVVSAANRYDLKALAGLTWEKSGSLFVMKHARHPTQHYRKCGRDWPTLRLARQRTDGTTSVRVYLMPQSSAAGMTTLSATIESSQGDTMDQVKAGKFPGRMVLVSLKSGSRARYLPLISEGGRTWKAMTGPEGYHDGNIVGLSSLEWVDVRTD